VPYPHAAGHQAANARVAAESGAALVIEDEAFDGGALLDAVGILADPQRHLVMSSASRGMGRPGAADAVAELVLALAEGRPIPSDADVEAVSRGTAA
jgi:UDP-N-acetylglucosamine--N-acetylmuramyl-(pentapeptide) pyrophosphoryl-undecaprenol N-acetylglucosamine transferase